MSEIAKVGDELKVYVPWAEIPQLFVVEEVKSWGYKGRCLTDDGDEIPLRVLFGEVSND